MVVIDTLEVEPDEQVNPRRRNVAALQLAAGAVAAFAILIATRDDPMLSPDSITYLSTAENLRSLDGYADFTGEPLSHFPPVLPALLTIGGRSLLWASMVGAAAAAAAAALFAGLLCSRVRWNVAVVGSIAFALSQALVRIGSTVWSETPYIALALATLTILNQPSITIRRSAAAGVVAGLGFLTRYAGAGLVATGLVMLGAANAPCGRRHLVRSAAAYLAAVGVPAVAWITRNLVATGQPLGPHFEGGAGESAGGLIDAVATSFGRLAIDFDSTGGLTDPVGYVLVAALLVAAVVALAQRPVNTLDVGMAVFALTSILVPVVSRVLTGTHIEARIMSPALIPAVYFAVVVADRVTWRRVLAGVGVAAAIVWAAQGLTVSRDLPERLGGSAGDPRQFSAGLYELVSGLPDDASVLTNNPQRVWWQTRHFPVSFAFTIPQPGNSHFPLSSADTIAVVCAGETYLAWFPGLANTRGRPPRELRPDLTELVTLNSVAQVPGGQLFRLDAVDPDSCADPASAG